jgi:uncharacterized membrane protein YfcA
VIGVTALAGLIPYVVHGNVDWILALIVGAASLVTARIGARLAARISPAGLRRSFAIFLAIVAARLLFGNPVGDALVLPESARLPVEIGIGLAVGLLAGYMGVGGGIIAVPAFTLLLAMPQHLAQGTSLAAILITAPAGAIAHARHGNLDLPLVPWLALGAAVASPVASLLVQSVPSEFLARAFAVFVLANAVHMWVRSRPAAPARPA